jgi:Tfp pilus assembly protein PilF
MLGTTLRTTLRTAHTTDVRPIMLRVMAFALAGATLAVSAACGGDVEVREPGEVGVPSITPVASSGTDSSGGNVAPESAVARKVSLTEAESLYQEKRYADAAELFTVYVDQRPNNPWGHYMLGLSAWKSGDLERAEGALVRSLELDPKHVKTLLNLSRVHLEQGRAKDARDRVTAALALDSTSGEAYRLMGRVRAALNQPNEAIAAYRVALSHDPEDVWSMNNMGLLMIQQGRNEDALGPLARAVGLDSTVAVFQNNLGIALEHTGRFALAAQAYKAAVAADAGYTKAKLSLARVEGRLDDPSVMPVELATLAEAFDREIRGVQMGGPVQPETVSPPER